MINNFTNVNKTNNLLSPEQKNKNMTYQHMTLSWLGTGIKYCGFKPVNWILTLPSWLLDLQRYYFKEPTCTDSLPLK